MSPCAECPLLSAAPKSDPLAERRAYCAARRAEAVAIAAQAILAAASWANVESSRWCPPWAKTQEGRKARTDEIVAELRADYGNRAVAELREEVKRRRAQKAKE